MQETIINPQSSQSTEQRSEDLFNNYRRDIYRRTDRLFAVLMTIQWLAGMVAVFWILPFTPEGNQSSLHPDVWTSLILGSLISLFPVLLALFKPGETLTRHVIAVGQMLMGALLIYVSGGRLETHFYVFASLSLLAFYRDWRVLIPATVVVVAGNYLRGVFFPQSVFGVLANDSWRWLEPTGWVVLIDIFLIISGRRAHSEMKNIAARAAALEMEKERYRELFENANDIIYTHDLEGNFTSLNKTGERITGYTQDEFIGMNIKELVESENAEHTCRLINPRIDEQIQPAYELNFLTKTGRRVWLEVSSRLTFADQKPSGVQGIARDITERKESEKTLRKIHDELEIRVNERTLELARANEELQIEINERKQIEAELKVNEMRLIEAQSITQVGSWEWNIPENKIFWSDELYRIFGIEKDEFGATYEAYFSFVHPDDRQFVIEATERAMSEKVVPNSNHRIVQKDGTIRVINANGMIIVDESGAPVKMSGTLQDITERIEAEEAIRFSEEKYRNILETIEEAYFELDLKGRFTFFNDALCRFVGKTKDDLMGLHYKQYVDEETAQRLSDIYHNIYTTGKPVQSFDYKFLHEDGNYRTHESSVSLIRSAKGEAVGFRGLVRDISQRKQIEEALRENEANYRDLFDNAPVAYHELDTQGRFTRINHTEELLLGYTSDELKGRHLWEIIVEKESEKATKAKLAGKRPLQAVEHTFIRKDGTLISVLNEDRMIYDREGKIAGIRSTLQDITDRKRDEEKLRNSEMSLAEAQRIARIGNFQIDLATGDVRWSDELWRIFGLDPRECGLSLEDFLERVYPDDRAFVIGTMEKSRREKKFYDFHHRIIRPDGAVRVISNSGKFIFDEEGKPVSITGIHQDITEQNELAEQLRFARDAALETARLKSEFLANMSHEIRTPMNGVIGMTGLLLETGLDDDQRDYAETIQSSADALLRIIDDILDFSKIEAGHLNFEKIDFDLNSSLESAVELFAARAQTKGLELASFIHQSVATALCGDPVRLRQILTNLIGNAVKFTEQGEVTVNVRKLSEANNHVLLRFEVADTGIGIAEEAQRRLFRAFEQADGSTTRKYGGTGLGLAISKQLIEMMGGEIGIESQPGAGSTFWFTANFEKQRLQKMPEQLFDNQSLEGVRVLIVDDNATNRKIFLEQAASWGMMASEANSGREALELLRAAPREKPFEIAILDLKMPEMNGFELAQAIKNDPAISGVSLILLPSFGTRGHGQLAREIGIAAYLQKPVRQSQLYKCLVSVLNEPKNNPDFEGARKLITQYSLRHETFSKKETSKGHILVVEDNTVNRKVALSQLQSLGYRAEAALNGREAIEMIKKQSFDVVLMDCQMPEMDGFEATAEIRRGEGGLNSTIIIAMTAHALEGEREKCLSSGMNDYLSKPVKIEMLKETLERWIQLPSELRQNDHQAALADLSKTPGAGQYESVDTAVIYGFKEFQQPGEPDLITELITLFIEDAGALVASLKQAIEEKEIAEIKRLTHTIKGSSGNIGARRMAAICRQIEENISDLAKTEALFAGLESEFKNVIEILETLRQEKDNSEIPARPEFVSLVAGVE